MARTATPPDPAAARAAQPRPPSGLGANGPTGRAQTAAAKTAATAEQPKSGKAAGSGKSKGKDKTKAKSGPPSFERTLDPGQDFRSAMRALIAHRWGEVWRAVPAAVAGDDIEGVHDVRVASRRLRAAMDAAVDCFPASSYKLLHRGAKEITGALGEVRDRDVLIEALQAERDRAPVEEQPGLDHLLARVERERVAARAQMEAFLGDLVASDLAAEVVRRFGPEAAPSAAAEPAAATTGRAGKEGR